MTEEEYAMKFCMLIALDEKKIAGMTQYAERFNNILDSYSKLIRSHPRMILDGDLSLNEEEHKQQAKVLREICVTGNIGLVLRQNNLSHSALFHLLVEAINKAVVLVHYYAKDGNLLSDILKAAYCSPNKPSDVALCSRELHIGVTTFYRRRKQAIQFAGYFFFEVVLPEMEGMI